MSRILSTLLCMQVKRRIEGEQNALLTRSNLFHMYFPDLPSYLLYVLVHWELNAEMLQWGKGMDGIIERRILPSRIQDNKWRQIFLVKAW